MDASGDAYVTGATQATDFPITSGAYQRTHGNDGGYDDAFVTELNPSGSAPVYSTFLGGSGDDFGTGIAVDAQGDAFVTGYTPSTDFFRTTPNGAQTSNHGGTDAFVAEFNPSGTNLLYSSYLGGSNYDQGSAVAVDANGQAWITGYTNSSNFPATSGSYGGSYDIFVVKIAKAAPTLSVTAGATQVVGNGNKLNASATLSGTYNPVSSDTITFKLYNPSGVVVDTEPVTAGGNGTYSTSVGYLPPVGGVYQWQVSFSGDYNNLSVTSGANQTVNAAPTVTADTSPLAQSTNTGQSTPVSFSANATGYPAPTVQWEVSTDNGATYTPLSNGSTYSGVTTTTLTITAPPGSLNGDKYVALFTNSIGSVTSSAGTLNVDSASLLSPTSPPVGAGQNASIIATSTFFATDQSSWQISTDGGNSFHAFTNGGPYSIVTDPLGQTTTLKISQATASLNGDQYRAVFTNANGSLITTAASLTVTDAITTQPTDQYAVSGGNATFTAASAYATDSVQWYLVENGTPTALVNGPIYSGVTTGTLTVSGATTALNNNEYEAVFTPAPTPTPTLTTDPAFLTVDSIVAQPVDQYYAIGQTLALTAASTFLNAPPSGVGSDTVAWQVSTDGGKTYQALANAGPYSGVATGQLRITGATADLAGNEYEAVFSNAFGTLTTKPAGLIPFPLSDSDPAPNTVQQGAANGQPVGITAATALNGGNAITYSLTNNAGGRFAIDPTTGVVTVANGGSIRYQDGSYAITVQASDPAGETATAGFAVAVTSPPLGVPADVDSSPNSVPETATGGTPVGITTQATGYQVSYGLTNSANGLFAINSTSGVVTVANAPLPSYSIANHYAITVQASDGLGNTSSASFTIYVTSAAANAITIDGYSLTNAQVNGTSVNGDAFLPLAASPVHLIGTVQGGQYSLSGSPGSLSIDGYALGSPVFTLSNSGLSLAGTVNLPLLGSVNLSGTIQDANDYSLAVTPIPSLGGFPLTTAVVTPSASGVGFEADASLPVLGSVLLTGTIQSGGSYQLSAVLPTGVLIDGYGLSNGIATLSASGLSVTGVVSLPVVGTVNMTGSYQSGQYTLSANLPSMSLGGVALTNGVVTLSPSGIGLDGNVSVPLVESSAVNLTGTILDATHYSLSAGVPNFSLGGVALTSPVLTLNSSGISLQANTISLPLVNQTATLTGTIPDASHYSLSATLSSLNIGIAAFSSVVVTLSDSGIGLTGNADLPFVGNNVSLTGSIQDAGHYSFSASNLSFSLGGFSLNNVAVTLSDSGLSVLGDATLPVIGTIQHLQGSIQDASHFNISAPPHSVNVGSFTLADATVSLYDQGMGVGLMVTGNVDLPIFGTVQFVGGIDPSGTLSISKQLPAFSLPGGLVKFTGGTLTLYTDHVHVEADVSVAQLADAHFSGDIDSSGNYELDASASLNIAGFSIPAPTTPDLKLKNGELDIGFDYGIPGLDAFLSSGGDDGVSFSGTYSLNGQWSLTATADFTFTIGPVVVTSETITLTSNSLTLGAHGSVADLGPLAEGDVSMTIYKDGSFAANVTVDSTIANFSLGKAVLTFGDHNDTKTLIATLDATATVPMLPAPVSVMLHGYWDSTGKYDFKGIGSIGLAGVTLANAQFEMTDLNGPASFTFSAGCNFGILDADVSGSLNEDGEGGFTTTVDVVGHILGGPADTLTGYFDSNGNYDFKGTDDLKLGPLNLSQAQFELSNTKGLVITGAWDFAVFDASATVTVGPEGGGYYLHVDATGTVFGQNLELNGDIHSNGNFDLSGSAAVGFGPFPWPRRTST